ncbi:MAG: 50S ribosomal protein L30 [Alphaproteobacteria bacterium]|nr:50S ribosomal protein L30 [Alphaproteobacteria bacterium]
MTEAKTKKAPAKKAAAKAGAKIKVTQIGSPIGRIQKQRDTLKGLGLGKIRQSKVLEDTPAVRGMITVVKHLVAVEDAA